MQIAVLRPCVAPYRPTAQFVQSVTVEPPRLYRPTGHAVPLLVVAPVLQKAPAAAMQGPEHADDVSPGDAPKVSAGHASHRTAPPDDE